MKRSTRRIFASAGSILLLLCIGLIHALIRTLPSLVQSWQEKDAQQQQASAEAAHKQWVSRHPRTTGEAGADGERDEQFFLMIAVLDGRWLDDELLHLVEPARFVADADSTSPEIATKPTKSYLVELSIQNDGAAGRFGVVVTDSVGNSLRCSIFNLGAAERRLVVVRLSGIEDPDHAGLRFQLKRKSY